MDHFKRTFKKYVNAAADLAESVKRNIIKDGVIDDKTVNHLNDFMIANNEMADLNNAMDFDDSNETNKQKH